MFLIEVYLVEVELFQLNHKELNAIKMDDEETE